MDKRKKDTKTVIGVKYIRYDGDDFWVVSND